MDTRLRVDNNSPLMHVQNQIKTFKHNFSRNQDGASGRAALPGASTDVVSDIENIDLDDTIKDVIQE